MLTRNETTSSQTTTLFAVKKELKPGRDIRPDLSTRTLGNPEPSPVSVIAGAGLGLTQSSAVSIGPLLPTQPFGEARVSIFANAGTGNLVVQNVMTPVFESGHVLPCGFIYNSMASTMAGAFTFSLERRIDPLTLPTDKAPSKAITLREGDGHFTTYTPHPTVPNLYFTTGCGNGTPFISYDATTKQTVHYHPGTGITAYFNAQGECTSERDNLGRTLTFEYITNPNPQLPRLLSAFYRSNSDARYVLRYNVFATGKTVVLAQTLPDAPDQVLQQHTFDVNGCLTRTEIENGSSPGNPYSVQYTYSPLYDKQHAYIQQITQSDGTQISFDYESAPATPNAPRRLITARLGNGNIRWTYNDSQRTVMMQNMDYSCVLFSLDNQSRLITQTQYTTTNNLPSAPREVTSFTYAATGQLASIQTARGGSRQYQYNNAYGLCTRITEDQGQVTEYAYDTGDTTTTEAEIKATAESKTSEAVTFHLSPENRLQEDTTRRPNCISQTRYLAGNPKTIRYVYDTNDLLANIHFVRFEISPTGAVTQYIPDTLYNVSQNRLYVETAFDLSPYRIPSSVPAVQTMQKWVGQQTPSRIALTEYLYFPTAAVARRRQFSEVDANGQGLQNAAFSETNYARDSLGKVIQLTTREDEQTQAVQTYTYDALARNTSIIDPLKNTTVTLHQDTQSTVIHTAPNGRQKAVVKDSAGYVLQTSDQATSAEGAPIIRKTQQRNSSGGLHLVTTLPNQTLSLTFYDGLRRPIYDISQTGYVTSHQYNAATGLETQIRYALTADLSIFWPDKNSLPSLSLFQAKVIPVLAAGDQLTRYRTYDTAYRLQYEIDESGALIEHRYDTLNRPVTKIAYASPLTPAELQTILAGQPCARVPDSQQDRCNQTLYDDNTTPLVYSRRLGNAQQNIPSAVKATQDAAGFVTVYKRDAAGRIIERVQYQNPLKIDITKPIALDQIQPDPVNDAHHTFSYDGCHRCVQELNADQFAKSHTYFASGKVNQTTYHVGESTTPDPNDRTVNYTYDLLRRPTAKQNSQDRRQIWAYDNVDNVLLDATYDAEEKPSADAMYRRETRSRYDGFSTLAAQTNAFVSGEIYAIELDGSLTPDEKAARIEAIWKNQSTRYQYEPATGVKISVTDPLNRTTFYYHDVNYRPRLQIGGAFDLVETVTDPFGRIPVTQQYITLLPEALRPTLTGGLLPPALEQILPTLRTPADQIIQRTFDVCGHVLSEIDPEGVPIARTYNAFGECVTEDLPGKDESTRIQVLHTFEQRGLEVRTIRTSAGLSTQVTREYNTYHAKETDRIDERGQHWQTHYHGRPLVRSTTDPVGATRTKNYDNLKRLSAEINATGAVTRHLWNEAERTHTTLLPVLGTQTQSTQNVFGESIVQTDALQNQTKTTYSYNAKVASSIDPLGRTIQHQYNAIGLKIQTTLPDGSFNTFEYDVLNRQVLTIEDATGLHHVEKTIYADPLGQVLTVTNARGIIRSEQRDRRGLLLNVTNDTNGLSLEQIFTYTPGRTQLSKIQGDEKQTEQARTNYGYDGLNRRTTTVIDPITQLHPDGLVLTTQISLDNAGLTRSTTDPMGAKRWIFYDGNQRPTIALDPMGGIQETLYDLNGNVTLKRTYQSALSPEQFSSITEQTTLATVLSWITPLRNNAEDTCIYSFYDDANRLRFTLTGLGKLIETVYNGASLPIQTRRYANFVDPASIPELTTDSLQALSATLKNDVLDLTVYNCFDGARQLRYQIDAAGYITEKQYSQRGKLVATIQYNTPVSNPAQTSLLSLDAIAALISSNPSEDRVNLILFDTCAQPIFTLTSSDGLSSNGALLYQLKAKSYDPTGNLIAQRKYAAPFPLTKTPQTPEEWFNLFTALTQFPTDPKNDRVNQYEYDGVNRQTAQVDPLSYRETTEYNALGQVTVKTDRAKNSTHRTWDRAGRLLSEVGPPVPVATASPPGLASLETAYTYDACSRCLTTTVAANQPDAIQTSNTYNSCGNVTQIQVLAPHLPSSPIKTTQTFYNAKQQDIATTNPSGHTHFKVYDADEQILWEIDGIQAVIEHQRNGRNEENVRQDYATQLPDALRAQQLNYVTQGKDIPKALIQPVLMPSPSDAVCQSEWNNRGYLALSRTAALPGWQQDQPLILTSRVRVVTQTPFGETASEQEILNPQQIPELFGSEAWLEWHQNFSLSFKERDNMQELNHLSEQDKGGVFPLSPRERVSVRGINHSFDPTNIRLHRFWYSRAGKAVAEYTPEQRVVRTHYSSFQEVTQQNIYALPPDAPVSVDTSIAELDAAHQTDTADQFFQWTHDLRGQVTIHAQQKVVIQEVIEDKSQPGGQQVVDRTIDITTQYQYDVLEQEILRIEPNGAHFITYRDALSRKIAQTDAPRDVRLPDGSTAPNLILFTTFALNSHGTVLETRQYATGLTSASPDALPTLPSQPEDRVTQVVVDGLNRPVETIKDPNLSNVVITSATSFEENDHSEEKSGLEVKASPLQKYGITDAPLNITTQKRYNKAHNLAATVDEGGFVTRYYYDEQNRQCVKVDCLGGATQTVRDVWGRTVAEIRYGHPLDPASLTDDTPLETVLSELAKLPTDDQSITQTIYEPSGLVRFTINPIGGLTEQRYDLAGLERQKILYNTADLSAPTDDAYTLINWTVQHAQPTQDAQTDTLRDAAGMPCFVIDPEGFVTQQTLNTHNAITFKLQYAQGISDSERPTIIHLPVSEVASHLTPDAQQNVPYRATYNAFLKVTQETLGEGNIIQTGYDSAENNVATLRYARTDHTPSAQDRLETRTYNLANELVQNSSATGHVDRYERDIFSNVLVRTDQSGAVWLNLFDRVNRRVQTSAPAIPVTEIKETAPGVLSTVSETSVSGVSIRQLDALGLPTLCIEGAGTPEERRVAFEYHAVNHQITQTQTVNVVVDKPDANSDFITRPELQATLTTQTVYNTKLERTTVINADGSKTQISYDLASNPILTINPNGAAVSYTRNPFSQIIEERQYATLTQTGVTGLPSSPSSRAALLQRGDPEVFNILPWDYQPHLQTILTPPTPSPDDRVTRRTFDRRFNCASQQKEPSFYAILLSEGGNFQSGTASSLKQFQYRFDGLLVCQASQRFNRNGTLEWANTFEWFNRNQKSVARVQPEGSVTYNTYNAFDELATCTAFATPLTDPPPIHTAFDPSTLPTTDQDQQHQYDYDLLGRKTQERRPNVLLGIGQKALWQTSYQYAHSLATESTPSAVCNEEGHWQYFYYNARGHRTATRDITFTTLPLMGGNPQTPLTYEKRNIFGELVATIRFANGMDPNADPQTYPVPLATSTADSVVLKLLDTRGKPTLQQDPEGNTIASTFTASGKVARSFFNVTNYISVNRHMVKQVTLDDKRFTYDANQNTLSATFYRNNEIVDPENDHTVTAYNAFDESIFEGTTNHPQATYWRWDTQARLWSTNTNGGTNQIYFYNIDSVNGQETARVTSATHDLSQVKYSDLAAITGWSYLDLEVEGIVRNRDQYPAYRFLPQVEPPAPFTKPMAMGVIVQKTNGKTTLSWPVPQQRNVSDVFFGIELPTRQFQGLPVTCANSSYSVDVSNFRTGQYRYIFDGLAPVPPAPSTATLKAHHGVIPATAGTQAEVGDDTPLVYHAQGSVQFVTDYEPINEFVPVVNGTRIYLVINDNYSGQLNRVELQIPGNPPITVLEREVEKDPKTGQLFVSLADQPSGDYLVVPLSGETPFFSPCLPVRLYTDIPALQTLSREIPCTTNLKYFDTFGQITWTLSEELYANSIQTAIEYTCLDEHGGFEVVTEIFTLDHTTDFGQKTDSAGNKIDCNVIFANAVVQILSLDFSVVLPVTGQDPQLVMLRSHEIGQTPPPPARRNSVQPEMKSPESSLQYIERSDISEEPEWEQIQQPKDNSSNGTIQTLNYHDRNLIYLTPIAVLGEDLPAFAILNTSLGTGSDWETGQALSINSNGIVLDLTSYPTGLYPYYIIYEMEFNPNAVRTTLQITHGGTLYPSDDQPAVLDARWLLRHRAPMFRSMPGLIQNQNEQKRKIHEAHATRRDHLLFQATHGALGKEAKLEKPLGRTKRINKNQAYLETDLDFSEEKEEKEAAFSHLEEKQTPAEFKLDLPVFAADPIMSEPLSEAEKEALIYLTGRSMLGGTDQLVRPRQTMEYDAFHNLTAQTDSLGNRVENQYGGFNQVIRTIQPQINAVDEQGHSSSVRPQTDTVYSLRNKKIQVTNPNGHSDRFVYDEIGHQIQQIQADSTLLRTREYNPLGYCVRYKDSGLKLYQQTYDRRGLLTTVITPMGRLQQHFYNERNARIADINPILAGNYYSYDVRGNITSNADAISQITYRVSDRNGQPLSERYPDGTQSTWQRDYFGLPLVQQTVQNEVTHYQYDYKKQCIRYDTAEPGGSNRSIYEWVKERIILPQPFSPYRWEEVVVYVLNLSALHGQTMIFQYQSGRLMQQTDAAKAQILQFQYDLEGQRAYSQTVSLDGRLLQTTHTILDALRRISWTFDTVANFTKEYDAADNCRHIQEVVYLNPNQTHEIPADSWYTYDAVERTLIDGGEMINGKIQVTLNQGVALTYKDGYRSSETQSNQSRLVTHSLYWDDDGRFVNATGTEGFSAMRYYRLDNYVYKIVGTDPLAQPMSEGPIFNTVGYLEYSSYTLENRITQKEENTITAFTNYTPLGNPTNQNNHWEDGDPKDNVDDAINFEYGYYGNSALSTVTNGTRTDSQGSYSTQMIKNYHFDGGFNAVTGAEGNYFTASNMFFESSSEQSHILTAWQTIPWYTMSFLCERSFTRYFYDVNNTSIWGSYQGHYGDNHDFAPSSGWQGLRFGGQGGGRHFPQLPALNAGQLQIEDPLELVTDFYSYKMQSTVLDEVRHREIQLQTPQKVGYSTVFSTYPPRTPDSCVANSSCSDFESLALQYYGDASYAPFIAEANGYSDDSQVAFGQTLQLPQLVRCKNNARTHSPYFIFANALINHFSIHLVTCQPPPPPPPPQDDDDSFFGDIVDAFEDVCAVVVGIAVGVASGGTLAPVIVGAMVAAATDAAAQVVNMAVGIQSKFSFQRIEEVAIGAAIGAGLPLPDTGIPTSQFFAHAAETAVLQQAAELTLGLRQTISIKDILLSMAEQYVAKTLPTAGAKLLPYQAAQHTLEDDFIDAGLSLAVTGHLNVEQFVASSIGSSIGSWAGNTIVDQYKNSLASTTTDAQEAQATQTAQQQQQAASQNAKLQSVQQQSYAAQDDSDDEDNQDDNNTDQNTAQSQNTSRTQVDKQQTDTSGLSGAGVNGPDFQKSNNDWLLKNYSGMFRDPMQNALNNQLAQNYADDAAQAAEEDAYNQSFTQQEVAQYGGPGMLSDATQEAANAALATVQTQSSQSGNSFWGKAGDAALTGFIKGASNPEASAFGDLGHPIDSYNNFSQADGYGDLELGAEIVGGGLRRTADAVMFFSGTASVFGTATGALDTTLPEDNVLLYNAASSRGASFFPDAASASDPFSNTVLSNQPVSKFMIYVARENQIISGYLPDSWDMITLQKGDILYGGLPGRSSYYTDETAIIDSEGDKNILYKNLQVSMNPERGSYRPNIGVYEVQQDINVPTGIVNANSTLGPGGATQYFISDAFSSKLILTNEYELGEFYEQTMPAYKPSH